MGCLFSVHTHSSDGTHDPSTRSVYSEPSQEKSLKGVSSYWGIVTTSANHVQTDNLLDSGESKVAAASHIRVDDVVKVGAFGSAVVVKAARESDGIVAVSLTGWTLATGKSPMMFVFDPQLTMRRVASRTGKDMDLQDVVVALAP